MKINFFTTNLFRQEYNGEVLKLSPKKCFLIVIAGIASLPFLLIGAFFAATALSYYFRNRVVKKLEAKNLKSTQQKIQTQSKEILKSKPKKLANSLSKINQKICHPLVATKVSSNVFTKEQVGKEKVSDFIEQSTVKNPATVKTEIDNQATQQNPKSLQASLVVPPLAGTLNQPTVVPKRGEQNTNKNSPATKTQDQAFIQKPPLVVPPKVEQPNTVKNPKYPQDYHIVDHIITAFPPEKDWECKYLLNHPTIAENQLLVERTGIVKKFTTVTTKIDGVALNQYPNEISNVNIKKLLEQAKDCCLYLFDQKVVWHNGISDNNIYITKDNNLVLAGFSEWQKINSKKTAIFMLVGAMRLIDCILLKSSIRNEYYNEKAKFVFPDLSIATFNQIMDILSKPKEYTLVIYDRNRERNKYIRETLNKTKSAVEKISVAEQKNYLSNYFDKVIKTIPA